MMFPSRMKTPSPVRVASRYAADGHRLLRDVNPANFSELMISAAYNTQWGERWHNNLMQMDPKALDNKSQWNDATLSNFAEKVSRSRKTPITQIKVYGRTSSEGKLIPVIMWSPTEGFSTDRESEQELKRLDREREKAEAEALALEETRLRDLALQGDGRGYVIDTITSWENDDMDVDDDWGDQTDPAVGEDKDTRKVTSLKDAFKALGTYDRATLDRTRVKLVRDYDRKYNARGIYNLRRMYVEEVFLRRADSKPFTDIEKAYIEQNILTKART